MTEDIVEVMARAIYAGTIERAEALMGPGGPFKTWEELPEEQRSISRHAARTALSALAAKRYAVVPVDETADIKLNDLDIKEFKPCVHSVPSLNLTVMQLADTTIVWRPWGPYRGHAVDLGYDVDGHLVGIQIWDDVAALSLPSPEKS
jgi:hypothetical protein